MDTKTLPQLNGIVGLSVLALLAAAIIAGQVSAKSSAVAPSAAESPLSATSVFNPEHREFVQEDALLQLADFALALPVRVEINIDGNRLLFENVSSAAQHRPGQ